jgi:hypothetical protein
MIPDYVEAESQEKLPRERDRRAIGGKNIALFRRSMIVDFTFYFRTGRVAHPLVGRSEYV